MHLLQSVRALRDSYARIGLLCYAAVGSGLRRNLIETTLWSWDLIR